MKKRKQYGDVLDKDNLDYLKITECLNTVEFCVFPEGNSSLYNGDGLYKNTCHEIAKYMKENSIKCHNVGQVEAGGGGIESFWEILKSLRDNWDLISFLFSMFTVLKTSFINKLKSDNSNLKPTIFIGLSISTEFTPKIPKSKQEWLHGDVIAKAINLINLGFALCSYLKEKHKSINYDLNISVGVRQLNRSFRFFIPDKLMTEARISRLVKIINHLKLNKGLSSEYSFSKLCLVKRIDSDMAFEGCGSSRGPKFTTYYLFLSNKLIKDYLKAV